MSPEAPGQSVRAGVLVLVVGPSGAGKDTVLRLARGALAGAPGFCFPRRVVTRIADASEDHDSLDVEEFAEAQARGAFALSWRAHGLCYGAPVAIIEALRAGEIVAVNVSRGIVAEARARFPGVKVALVTAPPEILAARLAARGRDPDSTQRLLRNPLPLPDLRPDVVIDNSRRPEDAVVPFVAFLRSLADGR